MPFVTRPRKGLSTNMVGVCPCLIAKGTLRSVEISDLLNDLTKKA